MPMSVQNARSGGSLVADTRMQPTVASLVWVASSFGFGDDLAYFGAIFAELRRRFAQMRVVVRHDFPVERYPELPLAPVLHFRTARTTSRMASGASYSGLRKIPTPATVRALWGRQADMWMVTEFTPTALTAWVLAKLRRRPVVLLVESDPRFRGGRSTGVARLVKSWFARHSDAVLTCGAPGEHYCRTTLGVGDDRLVVGPYLTSSPVGVGPAPPLTDDQPVRLLFVNSLIARKGLRQVLDALASVPLDPGPSWRLDVVGSGDQEKALREQVRRLGLADVVRFHGRVSFDEVAPFYAGTHVVLCPTLGDYRSLAGFEAVNAGRPVVLSVHDGANEELRRVCPGSTWSVDPLDLEDLAGLLGVLVADRTVLSRSLAAAATPPPDFSVRTVGDNVERAVRTAGRSQ